MKNLLKITGFEYLTCIRNKAFIIITVITLAVILGSGFLPALISSFDSPDEDSEKTKTIAAFDSSHSFSDELIKAELSMYFPDADVVISDGDMSDVSDKVNSGDYQFAVEITSPLSFTYITKNNGLYETDTQILSMAVKGMYAGMLLGEYGIEREKSDALMAVTPKYTVVATGKDQTSNYISVYILMCLLYMSITIYGNIVAQSVVSEKNTRTMELLITCAKPKELMFGKVMGSGLAGLTQLVLILCAAVGTFSFMPKSSIPEELKKMIAIGPSTAVFAVLFFVLGYFMYTFLIGALASCASKSEDLGALITPVSMIMMFTYIALIFVCFSDVSNSILLVVMSYLPLCSPMSMFVRVSLTDVAAWEIGLSVLLQLVYTALIGLAASAIYRAGVLMYGNAPKLSEVVRIVRQSLKDKNSI